MKNRENAKRLEGKHVNDTSAFCWFVCLFVGSKGSSEGDDEVLSLLSEILI